MRDPYLPRFAPGDLLVVRSSSDPILAAGDLLVFRVCEVRPDRRAKDRIVDKWHEPGSDHRYYIEVVSADLTDEEVRRSRREAPQRDFTLWSERKEEVLCAFRKRLAELEAL